MSYDIFLKIKGIKGDSDDEKHKEWIEVQSYSHDIHTPAGGALQSGSSGYVGERAEHEDFEIVKRLDSATPMLYQYCHGARPIKEANLELCRAMGEKTLFMKYTFKDVVITGVKPQGSASSDDALPTETVKLRYNQVEIEYTPTSPEGGGKRGATSMVQIDLSGPQ